MTYFSLFVTMIAKVEISKRRKESMSMKNIKEQEKESRGITLNVLVLTIIVLFILVGITIVFLRSNNGHFK